LKNICVTATSAPARTLAASACRSARASGLRVHLVAGGVEAKVRARLGADEGDQLAGVLELAARAVAAGQVAPQRHQARHAHGLQLGQLRAHRRARGADAREVAGRLRALGQHLGHHGKGAGLGGAARAVGDRAELGRQRIQLLAHAAQLGHALGRLGREEFETDGQVMA
jgi:hypothetical protein